MPMRTVLGSVLFSSDNAVLRTGSCRLLRDRSEFPPYLWRGQSARPTEQTPGQPVTKFGVESSGEDLPEISQAPMGGRDEIEEKGKRESLELGAQTQLHATKLSGVFFTASSRPRRRRRLRRRLGQTGRGLRPRCRTGPLGTRLASVLRRWTPMTN
jgi:hypothetical protein